MLQTEGVKINIFVSSGIWKEMDVSRTYMLC